MHEENCFKELTGNVEELLEMQNHIDIGHVLEQMYKKVKSLEESVDKGISDMQTEECAINLWNWGVAKRAEDTITEEEQAMVRHISCKLSCWSQGLEASEGIVERNILMAMETGKGWIDAGKPDNATEFLGLALNSLEKLYLMMTQRSTQEADLNVHKTHVERDIFKVLTYQAEAAVFQGNFELASHLIQRCKDMLQRQPEEAKVLRLLATVYLEWDCRMFNDKALNAVRLANEEHLHPAGLYLKMKILLQCSLPDDVISMAAIEMLQHELSLDIYLNTVKQLMEHNRDCVGFDFLKMICDQFEQSPDIWKVLLLQLDFLIKRGKEFLAQQKLEEVIKGHHSGKQLPLNILNHLHFILWNCAAKYFKIKNYTEALQWYNYSYSFYDANHSDPNLAKLLRNRASCFLNLNELFKAKEAVMLAEKCEEHSFFTQFILYKIAMKENDVLKATSAILAMGEMASQTEIKEMLLEENYSATDLLSIAAQIALDANEKKVAIKALESVVEHCQDTDQLFTSLRCMVRLSQEHDDDKNVDNHQITKNLISYLKTAYKKLEDPLIWNERQEQRIKEGHWFRKIAWNLAVRNQDSLLMMQDCFLLSYKLSLFCPCDKTVLVAQKSCLIMAASVDLEMARNATCHKEQVQLLMKSLENINLCQELWIILQSTGAFNTDPTETILLLYEFEAKAKLNDPGLGNVLDSLWNLPNLDTKTLESIASLSMEAPAYYPSICKKVLQAALTLHKKQDSPDVYKISKCLHSLIKLTLPERSVELENCDQEEAWQYYKEAHAIISTSKNYPEIEILWLMTRAWNTGIFQYSEGIYLDAERWCSLALSLLHYLGSLKTSYESKMTAIYNSIQEKIATGKASLLKE
ncbi:testis-expressed protein 11 isoform X3 [Engystomops pustulosus]|uniref:testis-expressed protein 11 isoform X3 n=1 Tax=Engystomops pustulosus TaxID=76066 RepID=UPI003AFAA391